MLAQLVGKVFTAPNFVYYQSKQCLFGFFYLFNFHQILVSYCLSLFWFYFFLFGSFSKRHWSLFMCGFHSPSTSVDLPNRILLSYQNVSVLPLAVIAARGILSLSPRVVYYRLLLLFLEVLLRRCLALIVSLPSLLLPALI